jgi:hypothetical protein
MKQILYGMYVGLAVPLSLWIHFGDDIFKILGLSGFLAVSVIGVLSIYIVNTMREAFNEMSRLDMFKIFYRIKNRLDLFFT